MWFTRGRGGKDGAERDEERERGREREGGRGGGRERGRESESCSLADQSPSGDAAAQAVTM